MKATFEVAAYKSGRMTMPNLSHRIHVTADSNQTKLNEIASQAKLGHGVKIMKNGRLSFVAFDIITMTKHLEENGIEVI